MEIKATSLILWALFKTTKPKTMRDSRIWDVEPFTFRPYAKEHFHPLWKSYAMWQAILAADEVSAPQVCALINDEDFGALMWQLNRQLQGNFDRFEKGLKLPFGVVVDKVGGSRLAIFKDEVCLVKVGSDNTSVFVAPHEALTATIYFQYEVVKVDSPDFVGFQFARQIVEWLWRLKIKYAAKYKRSLDIPLKPA